MAGRKLQHSRNTRDTPDGGLSGAAADLAISSYWCKYIIVTPNQLTAAALVIQYWVPRDKVNPGVFITIFLLLILLINYFGIRFFGEFEFWLSSFKVIVICGIILFCLLVATGAVDGNPRGFTYWNNPG